MMILPTPSTYLNRLNSKQSHKKAIHHNKHSVNHNKLVLEALDSGTCDDDIGSCESSATPFQRRWCWSVYVEVA